MKRSRKDPKAAFLAVVRRWAERLKAPPHQVRIQPMTRKWASCSTRGRVSFSTQLLDQPRSFRDFVVVHELLHLKVPNHGRLFKSLLAAYVPKWRKHTERQVRSRL